MLDLPNPLPPLENLFIQIDGRWCLTRRALEAFGPVFAEVDLSLDEVDSPEGFKTQLRVVLQRRRQLAGMNRPTPEIVAELVKDQRDQEVRARRNSWKVV